MPLQSLPTQKIKVIYVAGAGRSGSTVLANILGQTEGFFSAGELYHLWLHPPDERLCGCMSKLSECPVWSAIFTEVFGSAPLDTQRLLRLRNSGARTRYLPALLIPPLRNRLLAQMDEYLKLTAQVYAAICATTGSRVIVDSSKVTLYAFLLSQVPSIDLRVIHLVRDPRAVAFSFLRKKLHPTAQGVVYTPHYNILKSALLWDGFNSGTELFLRRFARQYIALRYEDFVRSPRQVVGQLLTELGEAGNVTSDLAGNKLPFVSEHAVELSQHHTVGGNPDRFRTGVVPLKLDDEWETAMRPWQRLFITALTWPLLLRYRYV